MKNKHGEVQSINFITHKTVHNTIIETGISGKTHASAVAQGNVVRAMSASYGKSLYSTLRRNQTP
jgi:hypothetical protein